MAMVTRAPTSDEAINGAWSGSAGTRYTLVDDYPDTTPNDILTSPTATGGCQITFGFTAFTIPAGSTSISVQVMYRDDEASTGNNNCGGRLKVGGNYYNASTHNPSTTATDRSDDWAINPATSAAWTVDQVNGSGANALQAFGINSSDASPSFFITAIQIQITYTPPLPTVTTQDATSVAEETATGNGNITVDGGSCDLRGVVYDTGTHADPGNVAPGSSGYAGNAQEAGSFTAGAFTRSLTSLAPNTLYYARAWAHNTQGYAYGGEVQFTTLNWAVRLKATTNIGAGGTDVTTRQLTIPSGKAAGDFEAGTITDDTNPLASFDPGTNKFSEWEVSIEVIDALTADGDDIEIRLTNNGTPLATYTVTPLWTIGAVSGDVTVIAAVAGAGESAIASGLANALGATGVVQTWPGAQSEALSAVLTPKMAGAEDGALAQQLSQVLNAGNPVGTWPGAQTATAMIGLFLMPAPVGAEGSAQRAGMSILLDAASEIGDWPGASTAVLNAVFTPARMAADGGAENVSASSVLGAAKAIGVWLGVASANATVGLIVTPSDVGAEGGAQNAGMALALVAKDVLAWPGAQTATAMIGMVTIADPVGAEGSARAAGVSILLDAAREIGDWPGVITAVLNAVFTPARLEADGGALAQGLSSLLAAAQEVGAWPGALTVVYSMMFQRGSVGVSETLLGSTALVETCAHVSLSVAEIGAAAVMDVA